MNDSQKLIEKYLSEYSAFQKLAETGEGFSQTARSLLVMNSLVSGQRYDYENIITAQCGPDTLRYETFRKLSDVFYPFRVKPDLKHLLEIYIILDGYSRTNMAEAFLVNLPIDQRCPDSREQMLLSMIKYEMIPEVARLDLSSLDKLRHALSYKVFMDQLDLKPQKQTEEENEEEKNLELQRNLHEYGEDEKLIVFASVICGIASLTGTLNLSGSATLTELVAQGLLFLIKGKNKPKMAKSLCGLSEA